ncbi:Swt1 family HEPN domain-containing protein [Chloroflexota bacterium]
MMTDKESEINRLLDQIDTTRFGQLDYAHFFIWYLTAYKGNEDCLIKEIIKCFKLISLATPNQTRLADRLRSSSTIVAGYRTRSFRIHRTVLTRFNRDYASLIKPIKKPEDEIRSKLNVSSVPLLTDEEIQNAFLMGQVYVVIHCLENSTRQLIRKRLKEEIGDDWFSRAASTKIKQKVISRKEVERKKRWLCQRGADELYYLDWNDLVSMIRKYPEYFDHYTSGIKFVESRLEEMECLRNIIAHSGVLPEQEIDRIRIHLSDWCRQIKV